MPNIRHELFIAATSEKIYYALSSPSELSAWWTPKITSISEIPTVLRFSFGGDYFKEMKILKSKPFEYVEWICITGAEEWVGTSISFNIESVIKNEVLNEHPEIKDQLEQSGVQNEGTLLILHHDNWRRYTSMFAECNYTWGQFMRSLKFFCESGVGKPWPTQHQN